MSLFLDALQMGFMQRALFAGTAIAIGCACLGVFMVLRRQAMIGDGLAHFLFDAGVERQEFRFVEFSFRLQSCGKGVDRAARLPRVDLVLVAVKLGIEHRMGAETIGA